MQAGPSLTILLDDYDIVHNKYLENRVTMILDKYEETYDSRHANRVIDFLGSNKTQIKKNVRLTCGKEYRKVADFIEKLPMNLK